MKPRPHCRYRVVVSAENTPYLAWQAKLLHFSCVSQLGYSPLVIVHDTGARRREPLHADFADITAAGGMVERAPNYRMTRRGQDYLCRNLPGTLLRAAQLMDDDSSFFVLCDPDMLFIRRCSPRFPESLSGEFYSYIDYDQEAVRAAASRVGLTPDQLESRGQELLGCGSPYVVPVALARALATTWLECVDAFDPPGWVDVMYAFGLAAARLGIPVTTTHLVTSNTTPDAPLGDAAILHYCYGDTIWDKRHYTAEDRAESVWDSPAHTKGAKTKGTALGEILSQIGEARDYYASRLRERPVPASAVPSALSRCPEGKLLLCCARTTMDAATVARIRTLLIGSDFDATCLLRLAHFHRTLPLLYWSLSRTCLEDVPASLLDPLREHFHANAARSLFLTGELIRLLRSFEAARIPALPFGGPVFAAAAYGNLALRETAAIELCVPSQDLTAADALLRASGYGSPSPTDDESLGFYQREDGRVTVTLLPLRDNGTWERRGQVSVAGTMLPAPAPADLLLALCRQGDRCGWKRLESVCDIAELFRAHSGVERDAIALAADGTPCGRALCSGLLRAVELLGTLPHGPREKPSRRK